MAIKHTITHEHLKFYYKNQAIEFEDFISEEQAAALLASTEEVLAKRLKVEVKQLADFVPETLFTAGRDLWRDSPLIKKIISQKNWGEILFELTGESTVRLAFDQFLEVPKSKLKLEQDKLSLYRQFIEKQETLQNSSCIQGVVMGVLICLKTGDVDSETPTPFFPKNVGNATFFSAKNPMPFSELNNPRGARFLLIGYAQEKALYLLKPTDPHVHYLKKFGYVFGDLLNDTLHPIVYRK